MALKDEKKKQLSLALCNVFKRTWFNFYVYLNNYFLRSNELQTEQEKYLTVSFWIFLLKSLLSILFEFTVDFFLLRLKNIIRILLLVQVVCCLISLFIWIKCFISTSFDAIDMYFSCTMYSVYGFFVVKFFIVLFRNISIFSHSVRNMTGASRRC